MAGTARTYRADGKDEREGDEGVSPSDPGGDWRAAQSAEERARLEDGDDVRADVVLLLGVVGESEVLLEVWL